MRPPVGLLLACVLVAAPAGAATLAITSVTNNSICIRADSDNGNDDQSAYSTGSGACSELTPGFGDSNYFRVSSSGAVSASTSVPGSAAVPFSIDAAVVVDAFVTQNEYQKGEVRYTLVMNVSAGANETWTLDVSESLLGLLGIRDDGDIGTGNNANAGVTNTTVAVDGIPLNFTSAGSLTNNDNNVSQQFSGSRVQAGVVSGTGNDSFNVTIAFDIDAFSRSGCSGFLCTGNPDEAAVLVGISDISGESTTDADEYGTWGRSVGPDGYNANFTLHVNGPVCGNGALEGGEECDDNNLVNGDGCSNVCELEPMCGNGSTEAGEPCDDGNLIGGDGCSAECTFDYPAAEVPSGSRPLWLGIAFALLAIGAAKLGRHAGARPRAGSTR
jgi:cysteine-rich repeat protein